MSLLSPGHAPAPATFVCAQAGPPRGLFLPGVVLPWLGAGVKQGLPPPPAPRARVCACYADCRTARRGGAALAGKAPTGCAAPFVSRIMSLTLRQYSPLPLFHASGSRSSLSPPPPAPMPSLLPAACPTPASARSTSVTMDWASAPTACRWGTASSSSPCRARVCICVCGGVGGGCFQGGGPTDGESVQAGWPHTHAPRTQLAGPGLGRSRLLSSVIDS